MDIRCLHKKLGEGHQRPYYFIPENPFAQNILRSFLDEDTSDVIFETEGQADSDEPGELVHVHAHKFVLQFCAPGSTLASMCDDYDTSSHLYPSQIWTLES